MPNKRIRSKNSSEARCCSCEGGFEGSLQMKLSFTGGTKLWDRNEALSESEGVPLQLHTAPMKGFTLSKLTVPAAS